MPAFSGLTGFLNLFINNKWNESFSCTDNILFLSLSLRGGGVACCHINKVKTIHFLAMTDDKISAYIEAHSTDEDMLMYALNRETHLKTFYPNMLSGKVQGKFLEMVVWMLQPKRILEIGTFTGYSALSMAKALPEDGLLYTLDNNEEIESFARRFFDQAAYGNKIRFVSGDALRSISALNETFDLVFIDADKMHYPEYYEASLKKLRKGGFILADNVLWGGKVVSGDENPDKETRGILTFNEMVKNDSRTEQVMLSIRDGLMLIRKL